MVGSIGCGAAQAVINVPRQNVVTVQSGQLIPNSGGTSYIQTAGKMYEIVATNASVKKDLAKAGNDSYFANVKGKLEIMADGREVIKATSITGEKKMVGVMGSVSFPRCGDSLFVNDGTETLKMEPMTESVKTSFQDAHRNAGFPTGTNFVGIKKDGVLQVWDVHFRMHIQPMAPPRAVDNFVSVGV